MSHELVRVGELAPMGVELLNQEGEGVRLDQYRGSHLVVYFYPMDGTPGCTVEGQEFGQLYDHFVAFDCRIVGVSPDSAESHKAFSSKYGFPFDLLSDPEGRLAQSFGVWNGSRPERATFVFDRELRLRRVFRHVKPRGHAQEVLSFVRDLLESHRMLGG